MYISFLPDTYDFNKTREWSEVRNALTSLGEDVNVVKIPGSKEYAGEIGLFDNYRALISSNVQDATNIDAFLKFNRVESAFSEEKISADDYAYDWRTNILWVSSSFNSYHHFFEKSNTEVRMVECSVPVRSCLSFGVDGDCLLDDTKVSVQSVNEIQRRYFCAKVEEDLSGIILCSGGFVYDDRVNESTVSALSRLYPRTVKVDLTHSKVRLNLVAVSVVG